MTFFLQPRLHTNHISWKDNEEIILYLSKCIDREPDNSQLYVERADYFSILNLIKLAEADYSKAISINYLCEKAYVRRSNLRYKRGDISAAIEDLSQAASISNNSDIYLELGLMQYRENRIDSALFSFSRSIRLNPNKSVAFLYRACCRWENELYRESITDLRMCLKLTWNKLINN